MNIKDFTEEQKLALLDLAMLVMYADGHLASAEDERVHRLLGTMEFESDYELDQRYDASVSRVGRYAPTAESAKAHATLLAQNFTTQEQRRLVHDTLNDLVTSDRHVTLQEGDLLSVVREVLQR
jgi:hypothetical protein